MVSDDVFVRGCDCKNMSRVGQNHIYICKYIYGV